MISGIGTVEPTAVAPVIASRPVITRNSRTPTVEHGSAPEVDAQSIIRSDEFNRAVSDALGKQQSASFSGIGRNMDDYLVKAREMAEQKAQANAQEAAYLEAGKRARPMLEETAAYPWQAATAQQAGTALMPGQTVDSSSNGTQARDKVLESQETPTSSADQSQTTTVESDQATANSGSVEVRSAERSYMGSTSGSGRSSMDSTTQEASSASAAENNWREAFSPTGETQNGASRSIRNATLAYQRMEGNFMSAPSGAVVSIAV